MIDPDDLRAIHQAAIAAQDAIGILADRIEAALPEPESEESGEHAVRWVRGNRTQITLSIAPDLLRQVDEIAKAENLSRAALLTVWINDQLRRRAAEARREAA